ncbi:DUF4468 domain-containing protein [Spirosoma sp.]|uniref:DUF4468 domain-containing protein n=1 Tax=Spirosoma sp. TaxID=1899569 RepID=UPI00261D4CE1|nr:DUF4468 domain-containing protein [Spirosoma sp.]MCX6218336.1 DUF4468 domain-containing protein [Spirosoma sp.]
MKHIYLLFALAALLLSTTLTQAQKYVNVPPASPIPIDSTTGMVQFRRIIQIPGDSSVSSTISRARNWVTKTYRSANDVVQQYDPSNGIMVVQGLFVLEYAEMQYMLLNKITKTLQVFHTVTIEAKSNRVRITIDGLQTKKPDYAGTSGRIIQSERISYVPTPPSNEIALQVEEKKLDEMPMVGKGWARRNAPVYLYTDRNIDAALYKRVSDLLSDFESSMSKKEKDW